MDKTENVRNLPIATTTACISQIETQNKSYLQLGHSIQLPFTLAIGVHPLVLRLILNLSRPELRMVASALLSSHAPLQRPELYVRLERAHAILPSASLQRPEVGRIQGGLDAGGRHLGDYGWLLLGLLVRGLGERSAAQRTVLLDVGGTLLGVKGRGWLVNVLLVFLLLVELKTFEVWEFLAGSPIQNN